MNNEDFACSRDIIIRNIGLFYSCLQTKLMLINLERRQRTLITWYVYILLIRLFFFFNFSVVLEIKVWSMKRKAGTGMLTAATAKQTGIRANIMGGYLDQTQEEAEQFSQRVALHHPRVHTVNTFSITVISYFIFLNIQGMNLSISVWICSFLCPY